MQSTPFEQKSASARICIQKFQTTVYGDVVGQNDCVPIGLPLIIRQNIRNWKLFALWHASPATSCDETSKEHSWLNTHTYSSSSQIAVTFLGGRLSNGMEWKSVIFQPVFGEWNCILMKKGCVANTPCLQSRLIQIYCCLVLCYTPTPYFASNFRSLILQHTPSAKVLQLSPKYIVLKHGSSWVW